MKKFLFRKVFNRFDLNVIVVLTFIGARSITFSLNIETLLWFVTLVGLVCFSAFMERSVNDQD